MLKSPSSPGESTKPAASSAREAEAQGVGVHVSVEASAPPAGRFPWVSVPAWDGISHKGQHLGLQARGLEEEGSGGRNPGGPATRLKVTERMPPSSCHWCHCSQRGDVDAWLAVLGRTAVQSGFPERPQHRALMWE